MYALFMVYALRMEKKPAEMLAEFHEALGQPYGLGFDAELRAKLQHEETEELVAALAAYDASLEPYTPDVATVRRFENVAQELADVVYVAYGTAHVLGIPLDRVLAEVHRANMSKFDADGRPVLRADGKLLKSDRYAPPDIATALSDRCPCCLGDRDLVCDACESHDCWAGNFMCEDARSAGVKRRAPGPGRPAECSGPPRSA